MAVQAGPIERTLTFRVDVDEIAKYAGVVAVGSAVLAGAGVLSVVAYLSAWNVPAPLVRLDPLTASLRSEIVVYQVAWLAIISLGLEAMWRRLGGRRIASAIATGLVALVSGAVTVDLLAAGFIGPVVTLLGGVGLAVAHRKARIGGRAAAVAFAAIALLAAWQTGAESGRTIRDERAWQTPVTLTARTPVGGLEGGFESGGAWQYDGLYLVFRDGEAVYVSRPGAGPQVWIVPAMHVMSLGVGG